MHKLEVITKKKTLKIVEPLRAKDIDCVFWNLIYVMDKTGKMYFLGFAEFPDDAQRITKKITDAILTEGALVDVSYYL